MKPLATTLTLRTFTFARRSGSALAETYDVTARDGELVGFVRLRAGTVRAVAYPADGSKPLVLEVVLNDRQAAFTTAREQRRHLTAAAAAIRKAVKVGSRGRRA